MFSSLKMRACFPPRFLRRSALFFAFDPESIDWWDYWINVHIPALRRWCYPLMEGRPLEARTPRGLDWSAQAACAGASPNSTSPSDPLWRSS